MRPASSSVVFPDAPSALAYEAPEWAPLIGQLAKDVRELRGADPLRPVTLVVSSVGMKIWITRELARHLGVAANIRAVYPRQLIGEIAESCGFAREDFASYSQEQLAWRLHAALGNASIFSRTPLDGYLAGDSAEIKRVQLARRLADTFDRYLASRPDMILEWDRAEVPGHGTAGWQSRLWRAITADLPNPRRHFPALLETLRQAPTRLGARDPEKLPSALFLLGIAGMPPAYLRVFKNLGTCLPVRVYQTIPSESFLDDLPKSAAARAEHLAQWESTEWKHHPLLMTSGKTARTVRTLLLDEFGDSTPVISPEIAPCETQLARLRSVLMEGKNASAGPADDSILFDSCHGPMREVEVLRDRLLDALNDREKFPDLRPRDILVLAPAIDDYAPLIRAVFDNPPAGIPKIPYSIADKPAADGHPVFALAHGLLRLPCSRMCASAIASLLESPVTRLRCDWDEATGNRVRTILLKARVNWGADRAHREIYSTGTSDYGTWSDFLARLRLSFALAPDPARLFPDPDDADAPGSAPIAGFETQDLEILGPLAERVERLLAWHAEADPAHPRPMRDWCDRFLTEINAWLPANDDTFAEQAKTLRLLVARLAKCAENAGHTELITYTTFVEFLLPELEVTEDGGRFFTEGVTFAAMKPLRTLPARVIVLLGINAENFPRRRRPDGLDLLAEKPRPGDPDRTAEDRGLFLDCLMAARDRLLLIFTGKSGEDDKALPLSPVVDELLSALAPDESTKPSERICEHPPFPYSAKYHDAGATAKNLFTYDRTAATAAAQRLAQGQPAAAFALYPVDAFAQPPDVPFSSAIDLAPPEDVPWKTFSEHFTDYARAFLGSRLGLRLNDSDEELPDDDLPDDEDAALDRSELTRDFLDKPAEARQQFDVARATGTVSPSGFGRNQFDTAVTRAQALTTELNALEGAPLAKRREQFQIRFDSLSLHFDVEIWTNESGTAYAIPHAGSESAKHLARAEITALALALKPERSDPGKLHFLFFADKEVKSKPFPIPPPEVARERLGRLVSDFLRHRVTPYPFDIATRFLLRESKETPEAESVAGKLRDEYGFPDPHADALWHDDWITSIESWDDATLAAWTAYEKWVWSMAEKTADTPTPTHEKTAKKKTKATA